MGITSAAEAKLSASTGPEVAALRSRTPYPKRRTPAVRPVSAICGPASASPVSASPVSASAQTASRMAPSPIAGTRGAGRSRTAARPSAQPKYGAAIEAGSREPMACGAPRGMASEGMARRKAESGGYSRGAATSQWPRTGGESTWSVAAAAGVVGPEQVEPVMAQG
jgi:hypothetical protein